MRCSSIIAVVLLCAAQGQATVLQVPGDQPTIQAAIAAATGGDTVEVSPGTYTENLDFLGKAVVVRSTDGPDSTVLQPPDSASPIVTFSQGEPRAAELTGFGLTGSDGASAVYISNSSPRVHRNVFQGHAGSLQDHVVIRATGQGHPLISHNLFYNNAGHWGIIYSDADSLTLTNNTVDGGERGLLIYSSGSTVKNNIVVNCSKYGFWNNNRSMVRPYNDVWNNDTNYYSTMTAHVTDISADPRFSDPAAGDYSLLIGSPCINAGDPFSPYDPDGTRADIGAFWTCTDSTDLDSDGVIACLDNCPTEYNPLQTNTDGDNFGDVCDECILDSGNDVDGDGLCGNVDNCPSTSNADQTDADGDGVGDPCDQCPGYDDGADADFDTVPDSCDQCVGFDDLADADGDGFPDGCDICPGANNNLDADADGVPDGCDICPGFVDSLDADSDSVPDGCDACPGFDDQLDTDGDTHPDGCDNCPTLYNLLQADNDSDGVGNVCDPCILDPNDDMDADGICGNDDNCPTIYNPSQSDSDSDGTGDACETVGVEGEESALPTHYVLSQNYPNPFNPLTTIDFALVETGWVRIRVYNIEGKRVRLLLNAHLPAGYHSVVWDSRDDQGRELSSGVYFYAIKSGAFANSKKMILLK